MNKELFLKIKNEYFDLKDTAAAAKNAMFKAQNRLHNFGDATGYDAACDKESEARENFWKFLKKNNTDENEMKKIHLQVARERAGKI